MITTIINVQKIEYSTVYAHLRYNEIRSLPNESNTIKNGRLRLRLIDLAIQANIVDSQVDLWSIILLMVYCGLWKTWSKY
jgi:hypothetical protein